VLSRIRDEAHRFAVAFHQKLREKRTIRSQLQDIPGIGPRRQQALLRTLGSVRRIRIASREELLAVPGMTEAAADAVRHFFAEERGGDIPAPIAPAAAQAPTVPQEVVRPKADPVPAQDVVENAAAAELKALVSDDGEDDLERSVAAVLTAETQGPEDALGS